MINRLHSIYADMPQTRSSEQMIFGLIAIVSGAGHLWALSSLPTVPLNPFLTYVPVLETCLCGPPPLVITMRQVHDSPAADAGTRHHTPIVPPTYVLPQTPPDAFAHYPTRKEAKAMLARADSHETIVTLVCVKARHRLTQCEADTDSAQGRATERLFETHAVLKPLPTYTYPHQVSDKIRVSYAWDELAPVP